MTQVGDWEASGAATGSFALHAVRKRGRYTSGPDTGKPVVVTVLQGADLVLSLKERCRTSSRTVKTSATAAPPLSFYLSQSGAVHFSEIVTIPSVTVTVNGETVTFPGGKKGRLRLAGRLGADSGRLTFSFGGSGAGSCTVPRTTFHVQHGSRLAIKDGEWHGRAANGQPVLFAVEDGGRAIEAPLASSATSKNPAEFFDQLLSFEFGQGCVNSGGGASCPTTTASSSQSGPPQPCLHVSSSPALIGRSRTATVALQDSDGTAPTGAVDASAELDFTSRTAATGTYTQPGDPGCSSRFTATAP